MHLLHIMEQLLTLALSVSIVFFEYIGLFVIIAAGVVGVLNYARKDPYTRLKLAKGFELGLEFKLGGEILRTVLVREMSEILIVGSIIVLRAALTLLIHWEIKDEEAAEARLVLEGSERRDRPERIERPSRTEAAAHESDG